MILFLGEAVLEVHFFFEPFVFLFEDLLITAVELVNVVKVVLLHDFFLFD